MHLRDKWICYSVLVSLLLSPGAVVAEESAQAPQSNSAALPATSPITPRTGSQKAIKSLRIIALAGQDAVNLIPGQVLTPPVVEVRDQDDLPVEGARVVFELPAKGPGGSFTGNQKSLVTVTNSRGQAMARGFQNDSVTGRFAILITASYQDLSTQFSMRQTNTDLSQHVAQQKKSHKWVWIAVAGAAGAGAGLGVYFTRSSTPIYSAGAGAVTVGRPQ